MKTTLLVTALAVAVLLAAFVLLAAASTYLGFIDADRFRPQIQAALEKIAFIAPGWDTCGEGSIWG